MTASCIGRGFGGIGPLALFLGVALTASVTQARDVAHVSEQAKLLAGDGAFGDFLGDSVSIDGDTAVVGASGARGVVDRTGAAYVFVRTGSSWTQQVKLFASDGADSDNFGWSVALDGDTVIAGAHDDDDVATDAGTAFVLVRAGTSWSQQAKLLPPAFSPTYYHFGSSVTLEGDTAVVGAGGLGWVNPGSAYVFTRTGTTWSQPVQLYGSGGALSLDGDTLVTRDAGLNNPGRVHVYAWDGVSWNFQQWLQASDAALDDVFGVSISLAGDTLLVGAPRYALPSDPGAAYVFERTGTTWTEQAKLVPSDGVDDDSFGRAVSIEGDKLVVGAYGDDSLTGAAYLFSRSGTTWGGETRIVASDRADSDQYAFSVALDGDTAVIGSSADDDMGGNSGSAYVYLLTDPPATYCTGKTNSLGCIPFVTTSGTASASLPAPFRILANDVLPGESGFLLYGTRKANLGFHGGKLCIKAPITRLLPPKTANQNGVPPCVGILGRNFNQRIQSGADPLLTTGARIFAQWRQRDPSDPSGFGDSLTNAVQFAIVP